MTIARLVALGNETRTFILGIQNRNPLHLTVVVFSHHFIQQLSSSFPLQTCVFPTSVPCLSLSNASRQHLIVA